MSNTETPEAPELDLKIKHGAAPKVKAATAEERERIAGHPGAFTVPFGQIRASTNIRQDAITEVASLAEDIRRRGILQPPGVRPYGEDDNGPVFVVEFGHRRWNALRALKLKKDDRVPVHLVTAEDMATRLGRQYAENNERRDLDPIDEAHTLNELRTLYDYTATAAADFLSMDRKTATQRGYLLHLDEGGQQLLRDGNWEIEAAQITGRLIKEGAPEQMVKNCMGGHRGYCQSQLNQFTQAKGEAAHKRQLEARGLLVVSNPRNGPAPEGFRTAQGPDLVLGTAALIKAMDPDKLRTVKDEDGKPAVYLMRGWDGDLHVFALEEVEMATAHADVPEDEVLYHDGRITWQAKQAANTALALVRHKQLAAWLVTPAAGEVPEDQLWPLMLSQLTARLYNSNLEAVAQALGFELVMHTNGEGEPTDRYDRDATGRKWAREASPAECRQLVLGVLLSQGIENMQVRDIAVPPAEDPDGTEAQEEEDELEEDDKILATAAAEMVTGIQQPLDYEGMVKVATKAMAKLNGSTDG